ncbi:MAG: hypothetical protein IJY42_03700 [Clostridia bacterium]|nr:hypothetical protein [Clostridia bacterium]
MDEIICRYAPFPVTVRAVTVVDENGDYNVYINASLSAEEQKKAFLHERAHIRRQHFYEGGALTDCEQEAEQDAQGKKSKKASTFR